MRYPRTLLLEAALAWCPRTVSALSDEPRMMGEIDRLKKVQCSVTLKRLMVNPHAWPFKKSEDLKALKDQDYFSEVVSKPLLYLETIKWKLEKGLYLKSDQFAGDIRILFCNAMLHYPKKHEIHITAAKLSEFFETKWKSFEEKWATAKAKEEEKEKPKPLGIVKDQSFGAKAEKKRKFNRAGEKMCPSSTAVSTKKQILDTILDSQSRLFGQNFDSEREVKKRKIAQPSQSCSIDELQRKKEREEARMILQRMERTVFIDDSLKCFKELEGLCGYSLTDCRRVNPMKEILGLALKDEFMTLTTSEEDKLFNRDWEEGEIFSFH